MVEHAEDGEGFADSYARWRASPLAAITERVEQRAVFDLAAQLTGRRVLDVGTGDGTYAIEAARRGALVTAIDTNQAMLDTARRRSASAHVNVTIREARVEALPFDDGSFDVLLSITVLCFVNAPQRAARELARVLAPGGRLVLGELNRFSVWAAERRVRGWLGSSRWSRVRFWTRSELAELVRDAGLDVCDSRTAVYFPRCDTCAELIEPVEPVLSRMRAPGAAFIAVAASKRRDGVAMGR